MCETFKNHTLRMVHTTQLFQFSMSLRSSNTGIRLKDTEEIGLLVPFEVPREPLTDMSTVLRMHILIRVDMCPMTSA